MSDQSDGFKEAREKKKGKKKKKKKKKKKNERDVRLINMDIPFTLPYLTLPCLALISSHLLSLSLFFFHFLAWKGKKRSSDKNEQVCKSKSKIKSKEQE